MGASNEFATILTLDPSGAVRGHDALAAAEKRNADEARALRGELDRVKRELAQARAPVQAHARAHQDAAQKVALLTRQQQLVNRIMRETGARAATAGRAVRAFGADVDRAEREVIELARALDRAQRETRELAAEQRKAAGGLGFTGRVAASTALALGGLAAGALSVHQVFRLLGESKEAALAVQAVERSLEAARGNAQLASADFAFLRLEVARLGLQLDSSASDFALLSAAAKGTVHEGQGVRDLFSAINGAGTVLSLTNDALSGTFVQLSQGISKGKFELEDLKSVFERIPGSAEAMARGLGVTRAEMFAMQTAGELLARDAIPALVAGLNEAFDGQIEAAANSDRAALNRLNTAFFETKAAIGAELLPVLRDLAESLGSTIETMRAPLAAAVGNSAEVLGFWAENWRLVAAGILAIKWPALVAGINAVTVAMLANPLFAAGAAIAAGVLALNEAVILFSRNAQVAIDRQTAETRALRDAWSAAEVAIANRSLPAIRDQIQGLTDDYAALQRVQEPLRRDWQRLGAALRGALRGEIKATAEEVESWRARWVELGSQIGANEAEMRELVALIERLTGAEHDLGTETVATTVSAKDQKKAVDELVAAWEALPAALTASQAEMRNWRTLTDSQRQTIRDLRDELESLRELAGQVLAPEPLASGPIPVPDFDPFEESQREREIEAEAAARHIERQREMREATHDTVEATAQMLDTLSQFFDRTGSDIGEWLSQISRLISLINQAMAASSAAAATGGGAGGGSLGSTGTGALAAAVPFAAVMVAAYDIFVTSVERRRARQFSSEASISFSSGGFSGRPTFDSRAGASSIDTQPLWDALRRAIEEFRIAMGGILEWLPNVAIQIRRDGEEFRAIVGGVIIGVFDSVEAAIQAGLSRAIASADFGEVGANVAAALQALDRGIVSLEVVADLLPTLRELDKIAGGAAASVARATVEWEGVFVGLDILSEHLLDMGVPLAQVIAMREREIAAMVDQAAAQGRLIAGIPDLTGGLGDWLASMEGLDAALEMETERQKELAEKAEDAAVAISGGGGGSGGLNEAMGGLNDGVTSGGIIFMAAADSAKKSKEAEKDLGDARERAADGTRRLSHEFRQMVREIVGMEAVSTVFQRLLDFQERWGVEIASNGRLEQELARISFEVEKRRLQLLLIEIKAQAELLNLTRAQVRQFERWATEIAGLEFPGIGAGRGGRGGGGAAPSLADTAAEVEQIRETWRNFMVELDGAAEQIRRQREEWARFIARARELEALTEDQIRALEAEARVREQVLGAAAAADILLSLAQIIGDQELIAELERERTRLQIAAMVLQAQALHELGAISTETLLNIEALGERALAAIQAAEDAAGAPVLTGKPPPGVPGAIDHLEGKPSRERIEIDVARLVPSIAARLELEQVIRQFEELEGNLRALGFTEEQIAAARAEAAGVLFAGLADQILRYVEDEELALEVARIRWTLEVANMRLQLEMLKAAKILTEEQIRLLEGGLDAIEEAGPPEDLVRDRQRAAGRGRRGVDASAQQPTAELLADIIDEMRRAAQSPTERLRQEWLDMIARIDEAIGSPLEKAQALRLAEEAYNRARLAGLRELQEELDAAGGGTPAGGRQSFLVAQQRFRTAVAGGDEEAIEEAARAFLAAAGSFSSSFAQRSAEAAARAQILAALGPILGGGAVNDNAALGFAAGLPAPGLPPAGAPTVVMPQPRNDNIEGRLVAIERQLAAIASAGGRTATATESTSRGFERLEPVLRRH